MHRTRGMVRRQEAFGRARGGEADGFARRGRRRRERGAAGERRSCAWTRGPALATRLSMRWPPGRRPSPPGLLAPLSSDGEGARARGARAQHRAAATRTQAHAVTR
eukprot:5569402-Prymnesium_polylepis.2